MKVFAAMIILISMSACKNSQLDSCIDSKVEAGMSASDAREECEQEQNDAQIRR